MRMLLDHETVAQRLKSYNIISQHRHRYLFTVDVRFYNERRGIHPQQLIFLKQNAPNECIIYNCIYRIPYTFDIHNHHRDEIR